MANELTLTSAVEFAKSLKYFNGEDFDLVVQRLDVSGTDYIRGTITASTSAQALPLGALATCGLMIGKNRGSVQVNLRPSSSGTTCTGWPAGIGYWCYLTSNTPYVISASSTAEFEYLILEQ